MVNQDGEPSKDAIKINTTPLDEELAREYQKQLHRIVALMTSPDGIGLGPTLPLLRNEVSYVESMLGNSLTIDGMIDEWLSNFVANYQKHFLNRCNSRSLKKKGIKNSALVVGGGPSINKYELLTPVERYKGTTICTNKSYKAVLNHNIDPNYVVVLHGTDEILGDFTPSYVRESMADGNSIFVLPTVMNPVVADLIVGHVRDENIVWYNPSISDILAPAYDKTLSLLSSVPTIDTGGNVGILSTVIAKNLGAKTIGMFGLEHCQELDPTWTNDVARYMEIRYAPEDGLTFAMSPAFRNYVKQFYQFISESPETEFINLVKNGIFYVDRKKLNVPYMDFKEFVNTYD